MKKGGVVYMLANKANTTLYVGVTSDLIKRLDEHKSGKYSRSFSNRYNLTKLVYFEGFHSIEEAIAREKQVKAGSRKKKDLIISTVNPNWNDLSGKLDEWL